MRPELDRKNPVENPMELRNEMMKIITQFGISNSAFGFSHSLSVLCARPKTFDRMQNDFLMAYNEIEDELKKQ